MTRFAAVGITFAIAAFAVDANAQQPSFAWAGDATSERYAPNALYAFNASPITLSRGRIGEYFADFGQTVPAAGNLGNVIAGAYGRDGLCSPLSWSAGTIQVVCNDSSGSISNERYTVLFTPAGTPAVAFATIDEPTRSSYVVSSSQSQAPGPVTFERLDTGRYRIRFGGTEAASSSVQIAAKSPGVYCTRGGARGRGGATPDSVYVECDTANGQVVDSAFSVLVVLAYSSTRNFAYLNARRPSTPSYSVTTDTSFGGSPSITRSSPGSYTVTIGERINTPGVALVTGHGGARCHVRRWGGGRIEVRCNGHSGEPRDTQFDLLYASANAEPAPRGQLAPTARTGPIVISPDIITTTPGPTVSEARAGGHARIKRGGMKERAILAPDGDRRIGDVAALSSFRLTFQNGDHKVRRMAVLAQDRTAAVAFADQNGDDSFGAHGQWFSFDTGAAGEVSAVGGGRIEMPIPPGPANHTLVLKGFDFSRADGTDANVRAVGIVLDQERRVISTIFTDDQGADWRGFDGTVALSAFFAGAPEMLAGAVYSSAADAARRLNQSKDARAYSVTVQYAWIPTTAIVDEHTRAGGWSNWTQPAQLLPNAVIQNFYMEFSESDHHLRDFGVTPNGDRWGDLQVGRTQRGNWQFGFGDHDGQDVMNWVIHLYSVRR